MPEGGVVALADPPRGPMALGPVLATIVGLIGFAWLVMIVYGGGRTARLGLLTGGAALMSMAGMSTSASGSTTSSMAGMHMAAASPTTATHVHTTATTMKMTMLGFSISGVDHALSWPVFGLFMLMWLVMVAAMMLPVLLPMSVRYHDKATGSRSPRAMTVEFISADVAVWAVIGVPAYFALVALQAIFPSSDVTAIRVGAVLVAAAGAYEFTTLKRRAHERCCVAHQGGHEPEATECCPAAEDPTEAPWRSGLRHGISSLACCGPVMGVLLLIGMMNVVWMLGLTALMFFERAVRWGPKLSRTVGVALVAVAVLLLVAPRPLPALA